MSKSTNSVLLTVGGVAIGAVATVLLSKKFGPPQRKGSSKPRLYVYDHCPFCCRVRLILGLKSVDFELIFLESAEFETPINLIGAKQAPILELPDGTVMAESWDIVRFVDENYSGCKVLAESSNREDLKQWINTNMPILNKLYAPRFHAAHLPEFARADSRKYFATKKEKQYGSFIELKKNKQLLRDAQKGLLELEKMFKGKTSFNENLSYDDIDLFGKLRGLTIVKGLNIPPAILRYLCSLSDRGDVYLLETFQN